jgi:membrane dipeptidase
MSRPANIRYIDFHCDTLLHAAFTGANDIVSLPNAHLDLCRLQAAGAGAQFFAIFLPPRKYLERFGEGGISDGQCFDLCYGIYQASLAAVPDIARSAQNVNDLDANLEAGVLSTFLTFEDGRLIEGQIENLQHFYMLGIRLISLTWNDENCFGWPNSNDGKTMQRGLKPFGIEALSEMQRLGIIVDVSHLSDGGFWDVVRHAKRPFVASHSNARALCPHSRNLTDEMIRALAQAGGVIGLNFGPPFLNADITATHSTINRIADHALHLLRVGGEDVVALGGDWDGIQGDIELNDPSKLSLLWQELRQRLVSERILEKMAYTNARRLLADTL